MVHERALLEIDHVNAEAHVLWSMILPNQQENESITSITDIKKDAERR